MITVLDKTALTAIVVIIVCCVYYIARRHPVGSRFDPLDATIVGCLGGISIYLLVPYGVFRAVYTIWWGL